jgi:hypothetical protein
MKEITSWKELHEFLLEHRFASIRRDNLPFDRGGVPRVALCYVVHKFCTNKMESQLGDILTDLEAVLCRPVFYLTSTNYYDHTRQGLVHLLSLMHDKKNEYEKVQ